MAENSAIEWTTHTFNPWSGCSKVSEGCQNCYAEVNYSVKMRGVKWGPTGNRIVKAESGWKEPLKWDKESARGIQAWELHCECCKITGVGDPITEWQRQAGDEPIPQRPRVFCASLADVFEDWQGPMLDAKGDRLVIYKPNGGFLTQAPYIEEPPANCRWFSMDDVRARLFRLINATPNLDWLLLTKRPESFRDMLPDRWLDIQWPHVWLGVSVENRECLTRVDQLRRTPAAIRFLSLEPLLEDLGKIDLTGISWAIIGGESGHGARPCDIAWIRDIVQQCKEVGVACFVKQLGSKPFDSATYDEEAADNVSAQDDSTCRIRLRDKKGGDMSEWTEDLHVREFPK